MPSFSRRHEPITDAEYEEVPRMRGIVDQVVDTRMNQRPAPVQAEVPPMVDLPVRNPNVVDLNINTPRDAFVLYQRRGRAISMFIEIPLLALVTFNDKVPGMVRLGAGLLAIWKSIELARGGAQELQTVGEEWIAEQ